MQKVLVDYEPKNEDPILASQYLSAVVGSIVATSEIPKKDKDDILKQLMEFTQYVYDQQSSTLEGEVQKEPQILKMLTVLGSLNQTSIVIYPQQLLALCILVLYKVEVNLLLIPISHWLIHRNRYHLLQ